MISICKLMPNKIDNKIIKISSVNPIQWKNIYLKFYQMGSVVEKWSLNNKLHRNNEPAFICIIKIKIFVEKSGIFLINFII